VGRLSPGDLVGWPFYRGGSNSESTDHFPVIRFSGVRLRFIDPGGVHEGIEKINAIVELLFTQFEGYMFSVRGPGQSMHGVGRLPWSYGPPDDPQRLTGTDVDVTKDGELTALYVFIDPPSKKLSSLARVQKTTN